MRRGFDSGSTRTTSNPAFRGGSVFQQVAGPYESGMTLRGAALKTGVLLLIATATAAWSWSNLFGTPGALLWLIGAMIGGFVLALVISFKPKTAPFLSPVYAAVQGVFMGAISAQYASLYEGIVVQAIGATLAVAAVMLTLYATGIIKVTRRFTMVIVGAMLGILVFYLASFVLGFFGINSPLGDPSPLGIGISVVIVIVAALSLALDFELINRGAQTGAPKYMEWYGAFALMVTLVWLYLEILRLLSLLRRA